MKEWRGMTGSG